MHPDLAADLLAEAQDEIDVLRKEVAKFKEALESVSTAPWMGEGGYGYAIAQANHALGIAGPIEDHFLRVAVVEHNRIYQKALEAAAIELESHCILRKEWKGLGMPYHDSCADCRGARIVRAFAASLARY